MGVPLYGITLESFRKSPVVLCFVNTFFRCSSNVNLMSKITPTCVWELTWETLLLLKNKGRCATLFNLLLNMISWACLLQSELKVIFHWKAQSLIFFFRSLFITQKQMCVRCTNENIGVSSANRWLSIIMLIIISIRW